MDNNPFRSGQPNVSNNNSGYMTPPVNNNGYMGQQQQQQPQQPYNTGYGYSQQQQPQQQPSWQSNTTTGSPYTPLQQLQQQQQGNTPFSPPPQQQQQPYQYNHPYASTQPNTALDNNNYNTSMSGYGAGNAMTGYSNSGYGGTSGNTYQPQGYQTNTMPTPGMYGGIQSPPLLQQQQPNNFYIPDNFGQSTAPNNNSSIFQPAQHRHPPVDASSLLKGTQVKRVECPVCQKMLEGDDMAVNHHVNEHYS